VGAFVNGIRNNPALIFNKKARVDEVGMVGRMRQVEKVVFLDI